MNNIQEIQNLQKKFFFSGRTNHYRFRLQQLCKLEKEIRNQETVIISALQKDLGKSSAESFISEISCVLSEIRYIQKHLKSWCKAKKVHTPIAAGLAKSYYIAEPYGLSLIVSPWNYPFLLSMIPLIGSIAAGNCCVLKPSEYAPATSSVIQQICNHIFLEEHIAVIQGDAKIATELLEHKWDYIFFTGSPEIGKKVMQQAAIHLTPITLELGGKSPCIIDETAHVSVAAKRIIWGKFMNVGQTCVAPDFILVQESIKDKFIEYLIHYIQKFYGDNPKQSPDYSHIVNIKHFQRLEKLMEQGRILYGGDKDKNNLYIAPTLLDQVCWNDPIMQEEIFGPLLPILTYKNWDEIIPPLQQQEKPLALYLFTTNKVHQQEIIQNIRFGGGCINDTLLHVTNPLLPFGGVGNSGMGSCYGKFSFDTFSHKKAILQQSSWFDVFLRYPPYKNKIKFLRKILR
ncbi:MAG: aldehyde dehydrogenase [Planctomycetes bacterium]|jgi:aldehyde dehydrogenase (NAD+)|nr:aldehyde dehydrogenase [Planctomycetota bacterium]